MSQLNDLYQQALQLPNPERVELAQKILLSVGADNRDSDWEEAWRVELEARLASLDRGEQPREADEVLADLRRAIQ